MKTIYFKNFSLTLYLHKGYMDFLPSLYYAKEKKGKFLIGASWLIFGIELDRNEPIR